MIKVLRIICEKLVRRVVAATAEKDETSSPSSCAFAAAFAN